MSDDAATDPHGARRERAWTQIRLAASFLTILPAGPSNEASAGDQASAFGWFPLIGFAIGAALCIEDRLLAALIGSPVRSWLIILSLAIVTGGLHLDGLADTADALGARADRARALEILRDSRIGGFGAIALILVIGLKATALAGATGSHRYAALYAAPGFARWAMIGNSYGLDYLRDRGAGTPLLRHSGGRSLRLATLTAIVGMIPLAGHGVLRAALVTLVSVLVLRAFYRHWLGGITGDLIGAAGEIVETAVLIALAC